MYSARRNQHGLRALLCMVLGVLCAPVAAQTSPPLSAAQLEDRVIEQTRLLQNMPKSAVNYLERADAYFLLHDFDKAIDDYTTALRLNPREDRAWYGRGLALARNGHIQQGINDLTVFLQHKPDSSPGYTKRGVRYLWLGDKSHAQQDLEKAVELDYDNAEAHDDLGVVLAQQGLYAQAADHFLTALELDASYQKAYHNMATISYLTDKPQLALDFINAALELRPDAQESVILKGKILKALGRADEAQTLADEAEFLPPGNWSEHVPLQ